MSKHTPETWKLLEDMPTWPQASTLAEPRQATMNFDDYRRAVACVNACDGINPEAVPDVVAALRKIEYIARFPASSEYKVHDMAMEARAALAKLEQV